MLIRHRIDLLRQLKDEQGICLSIQPVSSAQNHAAKLTRVISNWVGSGDGGCTAERMRAAGDEKRKALSAGTVAVGAAAEHSSWSQSPANVYVVGID